MKPSYEQLAACVLAAGPLCDNCEGAAVLITHPATVNPRRWMRCDRVECEQAINELRAAETGAREIRLIWVGLPAPIVALSRLAHELRRAGMTHMERVAPPPPPRETSASTDEPKEPPKAPASADDASIRFSLLELD